MRFRKTTLSIGISLALSGCGGGGGGGGLSATLNPYTRSSVPYYTPVKVADVDPLVNVANTAFKVALIDSFTADITGSGGQDVIIAGRMTQPTTQAEWGENRITMLSWQNGTLVDTTAQWFPGNSNVIIGTEGQVHFADFFNTGRMDMFIAPSTDADYYGPAYLFRNGGSSFSRSTINLGDFGSHGSAVTDLDGDGFKDIVMTHYGNKTTLAINDQVSGFRIYQPADQYGDLRYGGSAVAAADFLQNGRTQLVITDTGCTANPCTTAATKLYTWNIDPATQILTYTHHSTLPTPRFELPRWSGYNLGLNHAIYAVAYDFNDDRVPDVITSNRFSDTGAYSELQFLANNGTGTFSDVTDNVLIGYDVNTAAPQYLRFLDFNGDGLEDILAAGAGTSSAQILLKSRDGKYVASHKNILTDFSQQSAAIQNGIDSSNTSVNIIKSPDGKLYLLTGVTYLDGSWSGDRRLGVYLSEIGSQGFIAAQDAVNLITQTWPYMSVPEANAVLAQTAATYLNGQILDINAAMSPIGALTINGQTISGGISIPGLSAQTLDKITALDSIGRNFDVDLSPMSSIASPMNIAYSQITMQDQNWSTRFVSPTVQYRDGFAAQGDALNWTASLDSRSLLKENSPLTYNVSFTQTRGSPWFGWSGIFGKINSSLMVDASATKSWSNGVWAQAGMIQTSTNIEKGLVSDVSPIYSVYAVAGYRQESWQIYAGLQPVHVSGSVTLDLPSSMDRSGNLQYQKYKHHVRNDAVGFVGGSRTWHQRNSEWSVSLVANAERKYQMMTNYKVNW